MRWLLETMLYSSSTWIRRPLKIGFKKISTQSNLIYAINSKTFSKFLPKNNDEDFIKINKETLCVSMLHQETI